MKAFCGGIPRSSRGRPSATLSARSQLSASSCLKTFSWRWLAGMGRSSISWSGMKARIRKSARPTNITFRTLPPPPARTQTSRTPPPQDSRTRTSGAAPCRVVSVGGEAGGLARNKFLYSRQCFSALACIPSDGMRGEM